MYYIHKVFVEGGKRTGGKKYAITACSGVYLSPDDKEHWEMLVDASKNDRDLCIDYRTFAPVAATDLRLRILGTPEGIEPALVSFTAFGKSIY